MAEFTKAEPQKEHQWLQKLVGAWTWEHDTPPGPDEPAKKHQGTETVRSLDGIWIVAEGYGEMPDIGPTTTITTLGFDPEKKRFVGTFIGSMMTSLWIYEGQLDTARNALVLDTEGPSFTDPSKRAKYTDTIHFENDDYRILTSAYQGDDGQWNEFMKAHYRRKR